MELNELKNEIEGGDVKNLVIENSAVVFEIDYEKRYGKAKDCAILLFGAIIFLMGVLVGITMFF